MGLSYELGYASYFGIPYGLIKYDPSSILLVLRKAFLPVIGGVSIMYLIMSYFKKMPAIYYYFERFFWLLGLIFISFFACPSCWVLYLTLLIFSAVHFIIWLIDPLLNWKDKKSFYEKVEAQLNAEMNAQRKSEKMKLINFFGGPRVWNLFVDLFLLFALILCWVIGQGDAASTETFPIINSDRQLVVLKIYGDNIIAAPFDKEKGQVKKEFHLFKVGDEKIDFIGIEYIGILKPEKTKKYSTNNKSNVENKESEPLKTNNP